MQMRLNEIVHTIQGEGYWTGIPVQMVRVQGCNLKCHWCDTKKSWDPEGGYPESTRTIAEALCLSPVNVVLWTGGEPMLQAEAIYEVWSYVSGGPPWPRWAFHLETNGTLPVDPKYFYWVVVSPKPPDYYIHPGCLPNEIKIVVNGPEDVRAAERLSSKYSNSVMSLQPVDNDATIVEHIMLYLATRKAGNRYLSSRWRLSYQLHKVLGVD